ncbi:MAG: PD-(D/E)XK nuclease family protein [Tannerella sp.]|nr:PD-(D/E)XK nuclease family protein [Tannerella sp.]
MTPFLKQTAERLLSIYNDDYQNIVFVFPNKRSGLFFRKYVSELTPNKILNIFTISELFQNLNPKLQAEHIRLLFMLYDVYRQKSGSEETFDDFVYWGEMLLNDFDEIDRYLIDAKQLFTNVTDFDSIERDFSFLKPAQVQAIRSFWSSFNPDNKDNNQQFFLHVWQILYDIYAEFRHRLSSQHIAYEGMIYREVIEKIKTENIDLQYDKYIFIGLNALTASETELLKYLKKQGIADFYWDYSSDFVKDSDNKASLFMNENLRNFPSEFEMEDEKNYSTHFETFGIPSRIGQAKQLYHILNELIDSDLFSNEHAIETAIVLPDEQMLMPVLQSVPKKISRINVTLGYSVGGSPIASLMDFLQSLQRNVRKTADDVMFYHRDVLPILQHSYIATVCPQKSAELIRSITEKNQIYISVSVFQDTDLLKLIFSTPVGVPEISGYLTAILKELQEKTEDSAILEKAFITHYQNLIEDLQTTLQETRTSLTAETYFRLLKQMTDLIKIPFSGEPLSGLQIMGVLETRALDFKNVIILNANEDIFPSKKSYNSFIPYQLRRGFELPVQEHQESIWAYHFYRLIHRAEWVIMLYDTRTEGMQSGEVSRYIHQLRYHYKVPMRQKLSIYNISSSRVEPFIIEKDEDTAKLLTLYESDKQLSASAINVYLDCPVKFYFSVLKGIEEEESVSETMENDLFGTILHSVMELSYKQLCGKLVTADLLKAISEKNNMTAILQQAFAKDFFHADAPRPLLGQTYLYGETIRKYATGILEYDRSLTPFHYVDSEKRMHAEIEIGNGKQIKIKGFIDRIDRKDGILRIVDYKSGRVSPLDFNTMESLFDVNAKERRKAIMQVFLYAWAYSADNKEEKIQPSVYYIRNLFKKSEFDPSVFYKPEREKLLLNDFSSFRNAFEDSLRASLNEMFDVNKPFIQTPNIKICRYCPFQNICGKT